MKNLKLHWQVLISMVVGCILGLVLKNLEVSINITPFALAKSTEYFRIPREILVICVGRSTYARCGIITNVTPLEPEWEGIVTIEISNTTDLPAKVYANEGISQAVFMKADELCKISYADKKGKYQHQKDITLPTMK